MFFSGKKQFSFWCWVWVACLIFYSGCTIKVGHPISLDHQALPTQVELKGVPFFPQGDRQCGPASLAMTLQYSGLEVTPQELSPKVYTPGREGSMPQDMIGATRRLHHIAHPVNTLEGVLREVAADHPVIVLQKLGLPGFSNWHYAVVIGYDLIDEEIILRSGDTPRLKMRFHEFLQVWKPWKNWGMVVLPPGQIPVSL